MGEGKGVRRGKGKGTGRGHELKNGFPHTCEFVVMNPTTSYDYEAPIKGKSKQKKQITKLTPKYFR